MKTFSIRSLSPYLLTAALLPAGYALFSSLVTLPGMTSATSASPQGTAAVKCFMLVSLCVIAAACLAAAALRRLTVRRASLAVLLGGMIMRFGYMLYTPYGLRGHDIGNIGGYGHLEFMLYIFNNASLPKVNWGQFYHPPLNYILCALEMRACSLLTGATNAVVLAESARLVPCFFSCAALIVCMRLFRELGMDERASLAAVAVVAFHPTFFILSASINNDMTMIFFFLLSVLFTVRWYRARTMRNIIPLGVSIALAMMSKLSGGVVSLVTAAVFIAAAAQCEDRRGFASLLRQFGAFLCVCVPLALWYPLRNGLLFGQALGYVVPIQSNSPLYTGSHTLAERFLSAPSDLLSGGIYCSPWAGDYKLWPYVLRCSVFGEFTFKAPAGLAAALIVINLVMIILSLAAMIYILFFSKKIPLASKLILFGVWLSLILSFIVFNIKFPFSCTMDFRYIVPTAVVGAAFLGMASSGARSLPGRIMSVFICVFTAEFCVLSAAFYILCR